MKKIVFAMLCSLFVLTGCATKGEVKESTIPAIIDKIDNKDSFVLIVSRNSCAHCQKLEQRLSETINDHKTIIYNVKLDETSYDTLLADVNKLEKYVSEPGTTPHIYYIKEGKEVDSYEGYVESNPDEFWDFINKHDLENAK